MTVEPYKEKQIMYCGTCGKELRDGAKFCDQCGAVQPGAFTPEAAQRYYQWEGVIRGGVAYGGTYYYSRMYTYYYPYNFDPDSSYYLSLIPYPQPKR